MHAVLLHIYVPGEFRLDLVIQACLPERGIAQPLIDVHQLLHDRHRIEGLPHMDTETGDDRSRRKRQNLGLGIRAPLYGFIIDRHLIFHRPDQQLPHAIVVQRVEGRPDLFVIHRNMRIPRIRLV